MRKELFFYFILQIQLHVFFFSQQFYLCVVSFCVYYQLKINTENNQNSLLRVTFVYNGFVWFIVLTLIKLRVFFPVKALYFCLFVCFFFRSSSEQVIRIRPRIMISIGFFVCFFVFCTHLRYFFFFFFRLLDFQFLGTVVLGVPSDSIHLNYYYLLLAKRSHKMIKHHNQYEIKWVACEMWKYTMRDAHPIALPR